VEKEPEIPRTIQNHQMIFSVESMIDFKVSSHDKLGLKFQRNSGRNSGSGPFSGIFGPGVAGIIFLGIAFSGLFN
jgi:hypothetical protein